MVLEVVINEFELKRVMCLLKKTLQTFNIGGTSLNTSNFQPAKFEYFLTTVEFNSNKTYFCENALPESLGNTGSVTC